MTLDTMNNLGLWLTWKTSGCVLKALDAMNNSALSMTWKTLGCEFRALNAMNNSVVDDMKDFGSWGHDSRCYEHLKAVDDMNEIRLWG